MGIFTKIQEWFRHRKEPVFKYTIEKYVFKGEDKYATKIVRCDVEPYYKDHYVYFRLDYYGKPAGYFIGDLKEIKEGYLHSTIKDAIEAGDLWVNSQIIYKGDVSLKRINSDKL